MRVRALLLNWCGVSFWLFGVKSVWYIAFIVVLYAFYPLFFRLQKKNRSIITGLIAGAFVLSIIMLLTVPDYYAKTELAFARIPVFLLGSLTGELMQQQENRCRIKGCYCCYLAGMLLLYAVGTLSAEYGLNFMDKSAANMLSRLGGQGIALPVTAVLCILFEKRKLPHVRKAAAFLGGFTLELYLLHVFLGHIAERIGFDGQRSLPVQFLTQGIVIAVSVPGAWGFSAWYRKLLNRK